MLDQDRLRIVIAGSLDEHPEYARRLVELRAELAIEDRVWLFPDGLTDAEMSKAFSAADLCVLSSEVEGLGIGLLEAMSYGRPVLALRTHGIDEVVSPERGVLVDSAHPKDLADAIVGLLGDPDRGRQLGEAGRSFVRQNFDLEVQAAKLGSLYRSMLRTSG